MYPISALFKFLNILIELDHRLQLPDFSRQVAVLIHFQEKTNMLKRGEILKKVSFILICLGLMIFGCMGPKELPESFTEELSKIKSKWAPDKRTSVFTVEPVYENGKWVVEGVYQTPGYDYLTYVVVTENSRSAEILADPDSRKYGIDTLPAGTTIISDIITVTRR